MAFGSALLMLAGAVLSVGRISFAVSVEGRETRERVAVLDHRPDTTEAAAIEPVEDDAARRAEG